MSLLLPLGIGVVCVALFARALVQESFWRRCKWSYPTRQELEYLQQIHEFQRCMWLEVARLSCIPAEFWTNEPHDPFLDMKFTKERTP